MPYKISGNATDAAKVFIFKDDVYVGYVDVSAGSYEAIFDADNATGITAIGEKSDGHLVGYGEVTAIATGSAVNITEPPEVIMGLSKTGQTFSAGSGTDGHLEAGLPRSYTDNLDGTVTDNNTNLMWAKDGTGAGCNNGVFLNWTSVLSFANGLSFAGYTDWRVPNITEAISLIIFEYPFIDPAIDPTYFPNTVDNVYWTSTIASYDSTTTWVIWYGYKEPFQIATSYNSNTKCYVRCVRTNA